MQESKAYEEAISGLLLRFRDRYKAESSNVAFRVVNQSLDEFLFPFCTKCLNAKEIMFGELKIVCPSCNGSGLRRFSDTSRATAMQLSYGLTKKLAHKIRWVYELCAGLDAAVNAEMNEQLER